LMVDGLAELLGAGTTGKLDVQDWWENFPRKVEVARARTLFTEFNEASMLREAESLMSMNMFQGMADVAERRERLTNRALELESRAGELGDGEEIWRRHALAVASNPTDPWVDTIASRIFRQTGGLEESAELVKKAHSKAPNLKYGKMELCLEEIRAGRWDEALEHLREIERYQIKEDLVDKVYGEIFSKKGDFTRAVPHLKNHVRNHPEDFIEWGNLAGAQQMSGREREAEESYRRGLALKPDDDQMLNNLAWLLATREGATVEERAEAVELARRAVELAPERHRFRGTLAVALLERGSEEEGRAEAARAMEMAREAGDLEAVEELGRRMEKWKR
jgi:Flp pilus assembly protein TadD